MHRKTPLEIITQKAVGLLTVGILLAMTLPVSGQLVEVRQKVLGMD